MKWKGTLDNASISRAVAQAESEAERYGIEEEQRIRFSLSLEETLLLWRERCTESAAVSLEMKRKGKQLTARLILPEEFTGTVSPFFRFTPEQNTPAGAESSVLRCREAG